LPGLSFGASSASGPAAFAGDRPYDYHASVLREFRQSVSARDKTMGKRMLAAAVWSLTALCCVPASARAEEDAESESCFNAPAESIAQWRGLKFGLFIHWGPVSLTGGEIGWSRGGQRRGRRGTGHIPVEVYDNLYKEFDPVKFDAHQWVEIAKDAGMQYMVFTTKHHDGFCNFDTQLTDYKITSPEAAYGKDIVKQLADACHEGDLKWGIYYSQVDWHHPDYRTENHQKYINYLHGQMEELLGNYGRVDMIFFDGLGGTAEDWDAENLFKRIRRLQPHVVVNNRCGVPADYDTPEQRIGKMQTDRPWETCMTICRQWAWKPDDELKSLETCIQTLVKVVGGDGNLLFNVGPMPDGRIEPRQVDRLREIGEWLKQYGQSIYKTRGGPFQRGPWGVSTYRDNEVYVHILEPALDGIVLPPIEKKIVKAEVLTGGEATVNQTDESIEVAVPRSDRNDIDTILVLTLDGPAAEANPGKLASGSVAMGAKAAASNVYQDMADRYGPDKALDDDPDTRWATDYGISEAWVEVDLGEPKTIDRAFLSEAYAPRVRKFELQAKQEEEFRTFALGEEIGEGKMVRFDPVTAQVVRLSIRESSEGPTIWEFQLFVHQP
jgi:alpha-L-fucosidase